MEEEVYLPSQTELYNRVLLGAVLPSALGENLPHYFQTFLRNYIFGIAHCFLSAGLWSFYIYYFKGHVYFPNGKIPRKAAILKQMWLTIKAFPFYAGLATASEYMSERGWTRCFARIEEVGWPMNICYMVIYLLCTEFLSYWVHRLLHDIKPLFKYFHASHHMFNKQTNISPFAGFAFHPVDAVLETSPQVVAILLVPMHYTTYQVLFFLDALWSINIHDCIHGRVWPILGAGYHMLHYTTNRHNYGRYTLLLDWFFGTLRDPDAEEEEKKKKKLQQKAF
ncbi:delta(7)-sterol-C5(6)-desaturase-like [Nymphaea colorata]|nr:delta(7)-sterol-C5(6)-desaturase-like [Nymphaea colorata]